MAPDCPIWSRRDFDAPGLSEPFTTRDGRVFSKMRLSLTTEPSPAKDFG